MIDFLIFLLVLPVAYAAWRASWSEIIGRDHPYWDDREDQSGL